MKLPFHNIKTCRGRSAFTLVEVMVSCTVLVILIGSVIMCNLFGLSMASRQQIWLGASDDGAKAVGTLMDDIRSANTLQVGTYTNNVFTAAAVTGLQAGNALEIFPTTNTSLAAGPWTLYYYDSVSNNLVRTNFYGANTNGDYKLVSANAVTNDSTHQIFTEVDYTGTPLASATNGAAAASVRIYMSFIELKDPQIVIENGGLVDFYQISTTVTPRIAL